ncbi:ABC transporter substrate-binding protein [Maritimibacter alkaliphilus]|uniref:ABC transporter substrate-binding protein n=1 Tax=Maritimibacter alkaliphilus TaxID=404236 RepID=UPI001C984138|nr:ABC transporter substrate-binding protein [Maritimibacter alkaliphilus]MBY6092100.1 ABC transporter substrate-binding protein [Maritimibacter alkaliphilus]
MSLKRFLSAGAIALALPATASYADKANDTAEIVFMRDLDNPDLYYSTARSAVIAGFQAFDTLFYRDTETGEYVGNLATEWEWTDDVTLKVVLREGVTFHNGEAFNADDVVFTFEHFGGPDGVAKGRPGFNWIESVEKVDDYTVIFHAKAPFPAAMAYLAMSNYIYPNEYYAEVGSSKFAEKPVGTGPYMFDSIDPGKGYVLKANPNYFEGPKHKAQIGTINVRTIPDVNTQLAEMIGGNADFLWNIPEDQAQKLQSSGRAEIINAGAVRVGYITMDAAGRTDPEGPFTKKEVRQAVSYAIDRQAIKQALLSEANTVIDSACNPVQFGCETDVTKYEYNPEKAKELLAAAGYPDGFTTKFYAYRDRPITEAMLNMLAEVGIKTELTYMQYAATAEAHGKGEIPITFLTWGSGSITDVSAITSRFFKFESRDDARDEEVKQWLDEGDSSVDPEVRKAAYSKALKKIADEAYWLPLWTYSINYALSDELDFVPTEDEVVRFYDMSWK